MNAVASMNGVEQRGQSQRLVIAAVMAALFVSAISQTVIGVALPRIIGELGGLNLYSWVLTSSMLAATAVMPLVGKLSDIYGRKPFLMGGIAIFMAATAVSGASQNIEQLILFRAIQGVGSGTIMASAFAAIGDLFAPAERGKYFGLFTGVYAVASVAGPLIGGFLTDHLGWRWVFYVSLPFGLIALAVLIKGLPWQRASGPAKPVDWFGMGALLWAVIPLLLALSWAGDRFAWTSWQIGELFAMCALATVAFTLIELRAADPVLPVFLFRNRTFVVASSVSFLTGFGLFGSLSFMPLFIQGALGASATNSGLVDMPLMLGLTVASFGAGSLASRTQRYRWTIVIGSAVLVGGMCIMATLSEHVDLALPIFGMVIVGLGLGLSMPLLGLAVQNVVKPRLIGVATSSTQFFRQIGGTLGIAVFGTIVMSRLHADLMTRLPSDLTNAAPESTLRPLEEPRILLSPSALARMRETFSTLGPQGPSLYARTIAAMRSVLAAGLHEAFVIGVIVALLALGVSFLLPDLRLRSNETVAQAPAPSLEEEPWVAEGRVLLDVLLPGEPWYDPRHAEPAPEMSAAMRR